MAGEIQQAVANRLALSVLVMEIIITIESYDKDCLRPGIHTFSPLLFPLKPALTPKKMCDFSKVPKNY